MLYSSQRSCTSFITVDFHYHLGRWPELRSLSHFMHQKGEVPMEVTCPRSSGRPWRGRHSNPGLPTSSVLVSLTTVSSLEQTLGGGGRFSCIFLLDSIGWNTINCSHDLDVLAFLHSFLPCKNAMTSRAYFVRAQTERAHWYVHVPEGTLRDLRVHLGLQEFCLLVSKPKTMWVTGASLSGFQHHHECLQHFKGQSTGCD